MSRAINIWCLNSSHSVKKRLNTECTCYVDLDCGILHLNLCSFAPNHCFFPPLLTANVS
uniref:Uncharacterized protein n=1 Tax=Rhizophora mucronata TaxID=61149 RepID=A0A2P2INY8_RHIMU